MGVQDEDLMFPCEKDKRGPYEKVNMQVNRAIHETAMLSKEDNGIRPEKVALGKKLIGDENYPSEEVLDKVVEEILGGADK